MFHPTEVDVIQEDLDNGVPEEACSCALALALNRTTSDGSKWVVFNGQIGRRVENRNYIYGRPEETSNFVRTFDSKLGRLTLAPCQLKVHYAGRYWEDGNCVREFELRELEL